MRRTTVIVALAIAALLQPACLAYSQQTYPSRMVRLILPFGAASATDITARLLADRLSTRWSKPVVVENRPGGDGLVALNAFLGAHDDHTLFFGPASTFLVHLYDEDKPPYDPRDVMPIAQVYVTVLAISVPTALNVGTMGELIALARAHPGKLNAAAATGNSDFLIFGFIKSMGLQIVKVPYRDIMQAPNDLAEDRIQILSSSLAVAQPLMRAGRIKVLLVTQQTARARRPGAADRGRGRIPRADHGDRGRIVRAAANAGAIAREHCRSIAQNRRGRSDHRPAACRYRANHDAARTCGLRPQRRGAE